VLEAQEAPSWLQPCRGRACRHLRITGGGLHETRLAGVKPQGKARDDVPMRRGFPHPGIQLLQEYEEPPAALLV